MTELGENKSQRKKNDIDVITKLLDKAPLITEGNITLDIPSFYGSFIGDKLSTGNIFKKTKILTLQQV